MDLFYKSIKKAREKEHGFTLIEIVVSVVIFGILAAIAVPLFLNQQKAGRDSQLKADLITAAQNIEGARVEYGGKVPVDLPANVKMTSGALTAYSFPYDRQNFCLKGTTPEFTYYVSHTSPQPTTTDCTYTYSLPATTVRGNLDSTGYIPTITWKSVYAATNYRLYQDGAVVYNGPNTSITLPAMAPDKISNFYVVVSDSKIDSSPSNTITLQAHIPPPAATTLSLVTKTVVSPTQTKFDVKWTATDWARNYEIYDADTQALLARVDQNTLAWTTTITRGTKQNIFVKTKNQYADGQDSNTLTLDASWPNPVVNGTVNKFDNTFSVSWQDVTASWGAGATVNVVATNSSTGQTVSTTTSANSWNSGVLPSRGTWNVVAKVTTATGDVLTSATKVLTTPALPNLTVTYDTLKQFINYSWDKTLADYDLTSTTGSWEVDLSDSVSFANQFPWASSAGPTTTSDKTLSILQPTNGGRYYARIVFKRNSDGKTIASATKTIDVGTRMIQRFRDGQRTVIINDTRGGANSNLLMVPVAPDGKWNTAQAYRSPLVVTNYCVPHPIQDYTAPNSQGVLCYMNGGPDNGKMFYYGINSSGTFDNPQLTCVGCDMYDKITIVQNFYGDAQPVMFGTCAEWTGCNGNLQTWWGGYNNPANWAGVERNAGSGWNYAGSDTGAVTAMYDYNGYGSVGIMASLRNAPWQRYYPSWKDPARGRAGQLTSFINQQISFESAGSPYPWFPPKTLGSYQFARTLGNVVSPDGRIVPAIGFGPQNYLDMFTGDGKGNYYAVAPGYAGYTDDPYIGYPEQRFPIRR